VRADKTACWPMNRYLKSPVHILSLGLGTGLAPYAPGTFGTLVGFPLFWALAYLPPDIKFATYLALFVLGCWLCAKTGEALGKHDHSSIVIDEIVAMALVLEFVPGSWLWWLAAFGLFRLFDIWKPWPIYLVDDAQGSGMLGGFYVMLDDIAAAIYAIAILVLLQYLISV